MRENKMLDLVLKKIEEITLDCAEHKHNCNNPTFSYFLDSNIAQLPLFCNLIVNGTEDENLEYVISYLKTIWNKMPTFIKDTQSLKCSCNKLIYQTLRQSISSTISACEQRQESVKLLQEGYSGKCIL